MQKIIVPKKKTLPPPLKQKQNRTKKKKIQIKKRNPQKIPKENKKANTDPQKVSIV